MLDRHGVAADGLPAEGRPPWLLPAAIVALASTLALALWWQRPAEDVLQIMSEEGLVERVSAWGFVAVALAPFWLHPAHATLRSRLALAVMLLAFGLREMDWHKAWTETSMLRVSFYYGPASWSAKLTSLAAMAAIVLALAWLLRRGALPAWQAWRRRQPAAVALAWFVAVLVASKVVDRSLNLITDYSGWIAPLPWQALQLALEESWEMCLPPLAWLALHRWRCEGGPAARQTPGSAKTVNTPV